MNVSFTRKISISEPGSVGSPLREIEVDVDAWVVLGEGGPDPTEIVINSVMFDGEDITAKMPEDVLDRLADDAADVAFDHQACAEPDL